MPTTPSGVEYLDPDDTFDPTGIALAASMDGRLIVPVANTTARDAAATAFAPTASKPLYIDQADRPVWSKLRRTEDGANYYAPNRPIVMRAYRAADGVLANNTPTTIALDSEFEDPFNINSGGIVTIPTGGAGLWYVEGGAKFSAFASGVCYVMLSAAGTEYNGDISPGLGGSYGVQLSVQRLLRLNDGNVVSLRAAQVSGGSLTLEGGAIHTYLHMVRMAD